MKHCSVALWESPSNREFAGPEDFLSQGKSPVEPIAAILGGTTGSSAESLPPPKPLGVIEIVPDDDSEELIDVESHYVSASPPADYVKESTSIILEQLHFSRGIK